MGKTTYQDLAAPLLGKLAAGAVGGGLKMDPHACGVAGRLLNVLSTSLDQLSDHKCIAEEIVREICELPDRTSPPDQPEMLMFSASELAVLIENILISRTFEVE